MATAAGQSGGEAARHVAQPASPQGDHERALAVASQAVDADPSDVAARLARAAIYDASRRHRDAIADYDAALRESPDSPGVLYLRGRSRFKAGDVKGSVEDFDRAAGLDEALEKRLWERGIAYYYAKEFADYRRKKPTPYMERLHFVPGTRDAADPDVRILSDEDLQAAVKEGEARG